MYQSNEQISTAFFAAVSLLENIPEYWKLNPSILRRRRKNPITKTTTGASHCYCSDEDKVTGFYSLFPIFPSSCQVAQGVFSVLPFYYLVAYRATRAFPIVEVIEVPLIHPQLKFSNMEKEKIDSLVFCMGKTHIASQINITTANLAQEINKIRKSVLFKIFSASPAGTAAYFSCFSFLAQDCFGRIENCYINSLSPGAEDISWSFQSKKIIPVKQDKAVFCFTLNSWALNKHEV